MSYKKQRISSNHSSYITGSAYQELGGNRRRISARASTRARPPIGCRKSSNGQRPESPYYPICVRLIAPGAFVIRAEERREPRRRGAHRCISRGVSAQHAAAGGGYNFHASGPRRAAAESAGAEFVRYCSRCRRRRLLCLLCVYMCVPRGVGIFVAPLAFHDRDCCFFFMFLDVLRGRVFFFVFAREYTDSELPRYDLKPEGSSHPKTGISGKSKTTFYSVCNIDLKKCL